MIVITKISSFFPYSFIRAIVTITIGFIRLYSNAKVKYSFSKCISDGFWRFTNYIGYFGDWYIAASKAWGIHVNDIAFICHRQFSFHLKCNVSFIVGQFCKFQKYHLDLLLKKLVLNVEGILTITFFSDFSFIKKFLNSFFYCADGNTRT